MKYKSVLELNHVEAKMYFMDAKRYCSQELPDYFDFKPLLDDIDTQLMALGKELDTRPSKNCENVNYKLLMNKDGQYQWRQISLIHPVLYIDLVNLITKEDNWKTIVERFKSLKQEKIVCCSYPIVKPTKEKKHTILNWYQNFERKTIEEFINFNWMVKTDISNCYGSIYTHSIAWALVGKDEAKRTKGQTNLFHNKIDSKIQGLQYGQTNGIPQGSVLMDFIAELVLAYADYLLAEKCKENDIEGYKILRYRDDYRILTKTKNTAEKILKLLSVTLGELNLKLNEQKTLITDDVIIEAIKKEKLAYLTSPINQDCNYSDRLISILKYEKDYPNNSQAIKILQRFFNKIKGKNKLSDLPQLISINTELMVDYPKNYAVCSAIFSKLFSLMNDFVAYEYIDKILKKCDDKPYTEYLEIWFQRITIVKDRNCKYNNSKLCQKVYKTGVNLWDSTWINEPAIHINDDLIINEDKIKKLKKIISIEEITEFEDY